MWAYRTIVRTPTQNTPYQLVFGGEPILPLDVQLPSLRIAIQESFPNDENAKLRLQELEALDEKRLEAQQKLEAYQARASNAFNKKVKIGSFKKGDSVLTIKRPIVISRLSRGNFDQKWEGPYVVQKVFTNGAYQLVTQDGDRTLPPINGCFIKRYCA